MATKRFTPAISINKDEDGNFSFGGIFKMIRVQGGTFTMGAFGKCAEGSRVEETPIHEVTLSDYFIGQTPVTRALWHRVMDGERPKDGLIPMGRITWFDCYKFIRKLNCLTGYKYHFDLPTEAQWEFAARGGVKSRGFRYSGSDSLDEVAWFEQNSGDARHHVALKKPNELGVFDMSGNIGEWCTDEWDRYPETPQTDPSPEPEGAFKVIRGGSFSDGTVRCRVSDRRNWDPSGKAPSIGFRLVMKIKEFDING